MKKVILDHDLGSDCDDAAAAAIVLKAHKRGECKCLAITHAIGDHYGAYCIAAIAEYFGVSDVEIGINLENNKMTEYYYHDVTKAPAEKYFKGREFPKLESNVRILRRIFANNGARDITFMSTGPMTTLFELLHTGADDISPKSGLELFRENVCEYVAGACCFCDPNNLEWNIRADSESSMYVINELHLPTVYVGNNVGGCIITGESLRDCDENYPVRDSYFLLNEGPEGLRNSWDQAVVLFALYGGMGFWDVKHGVSVRITEEGKTVLTEGGNDSYVYQVGDSEEIKAYINRAMSPEM